MQSAEEQSRKIDKKGRKSLGEIAPFNKSSNLKYLDMQVETIHYIQKTTSNTKVHVQVSIHYNNNINKN